MPNSGSEAFEAFGGLLADAARKITHAASAELLVARNKGETGFDPVTDADLQAERAIRSLIEAQFPDHGIRGEELSAKAASSRYTWSIDPIDGTRSFICGIPTWTTLISLMEDGVPVLGIIDAPAANERYIGSYGRSRLIGAGGSRTISVSTCCRLGEARLATTDPYLFDSAERALFDRVQRQARLTRFGTDAYAYARLAAGGLDLVIESGLRPHDINALVPVVRGGGGIIANWRGGPDLSRGDVVAAATQELFEEAVGLLSG